MRKMTPTPRFTISGLLVLALCWAPTASAQLFDSLSTGADGALSPVTDTEIALPADGILHYTSINVPKGVTVTFKRNLANTPVYLLSQGDIAVAGTIDVSGKKGVSVQGLYGFSYLGGEGGPGGSDGGSVGFYGNGDGFGPGPGHETSGSYERAAGGGASPISAGKGGSCCGYGCGNAGGGSAYADIGMFFLHGGSGGGAANSRPGGGGGGVIVLASTTKITIDGSIKAVGGSAFKNSSGGGGGGGGGAIRLASPEIGGTGVLDSRDASVDCSSCSGGCGGDGLVRIEGFLITGDLVTNSTPGAITAIPEKGFPYPIDQRPRLKVTKVGTKSATLDKAYSHVHRQPGVKVPQGVEITIEVEASYVPLGTKVKLKLNTQGNGEVIAETVGLVGTIDKSTASAKLTIPAGMKVGVVEAWIPKVDVLNNPAP